MKIDKISRPLYDILTEAMTDTCMNISLDEIPPREDVIPEWIETLKDYKASEDYRSIYPDELHELEMFTDDEIRDIGNQLYDIM